MATTLPRLQVSFDDKHIFDMLKQMAREEGRSMAQVVYGLIKTALELGEDLSLGDTAKERLKSFGRDDGLSTQEMLRWNHSRKKRS